MPLRIPSRNGEPVEARPLDVLAAEERRKELRSDDRKDLRESFPWRFLLPDPYL